MDAKNETIGESVIFRHALAVRITHWVNVLCLLILLMSGLQIFNAHTRLYFGHSSEPQNAVLDMRAAQKADGTPVGLTTIGNTTFDTTGVLWFVWKCLWRIGGARLSELDHPAVVP